MRLRQLSLERFGRFEGCDLAFRGGAPDLHIVYGANEAGKTTSMAAVSDLLFGFEERSRYNFLFEYPLLRVGAVLEEDGRVLAIRRRKARTGSLVDAADRPVDEGPLAAMLHGQGREAFRMAFSLDHLRLREGGRAIVQARDDVGQALFAAGSGMTGIVAALAAIEQEADAIWGARAAQRRTYTQAERAHEAARTAARDRQIRPKAWSEAQAALADAEAARTQAETARDALVAEQRRLERLRRTGPAMQRRADLLAALALDADVAVLPEAREERILAALDAMAGAERARSAASALLGEAEERIAALADDAAALAAADAIEALVERRGEMLKARTDAERLTTERRLKEVRIADLRRDVGVADRDLPSRTAVARLRALAKAHGEAVAALRTVGEAQEDLRARLAPLERWLADAELTEELGELVVAVDAARRLGDGVDARCDAAAAAAEAARAAAALARERLAPWTGDADALARSATIADDEIAAADAELALAREARRAAAEDVQRHAEEADRLALDRAALARGGQAVSDAELEDARRMREAQWQALRDVVRGIAAAVDPVGSSDAYERAVIGADRLADQRFTFAEGSGKLGLLDQQAAGLDLRRAQAEARRAAAEAAIVGALDRWHARTADAGLPRFEPVRLRGWLGERAAALDAQALAGRLADAAASDAAQRRAARAALVARMPDPAPGSEALAPVLREAERRRAAGEAQDAAWRAAHAEIRQLTDALATHARQSRDRASDRDRALAEWDAVQAPLGLALAIDEGDARLSLIEELRAGVDEAAALTARLAGIATDRARFDADLAGVWSDLAGDGAPDLDALRGRLAAARSVAATRAGLDADRARRAGEVESAAATYRAAAASLAPVLADLGGVEAAALDAAVQASRRVRAAREALAGAEEEVLRGGEGHAIDTLAAQWREADPDAVVARADALVALLAEANARVAAAAEAAGDARRAFALLDVAGDDAAAAMAEAEQARAEMAAQAETYLAKRAQAVTLRWAIERYRRERQDPLLVRAGALFRRLTLGRYVDLRIDHDAATPRLLGMRDDGRQAIDVEAMSDGTADQLFLALRLAAAEQSVAAGVRLPFLADDLFINFDDDRARAGFEVLAELAATTQVLFFTHHAHLADIARTVVGADLHSQCDL